MNIVLIVAMALVVVISNILVQKTIGQYLTYAAFTYPIAFLITDLANKISGAVLAKKVVMIGFALGVTLSLYAAYHGVSTWRIAIASGAAFLLAQLVDIKIFDRLRHAHWWKTPVISSFFGSIVDTTIFFSIAFSATTFKILSDTNNWAFELSPIFGLGSDQPFWISMAIADFSIKCIMVIVLLLPYRLALRYAAKN